MGAALRLGGRAVAQERMDSHEETEKGIFETLVLRGKENDESTRDLEGDLNSLGWVAKKEEEDTLEQGDGLGEEKGQVGPRESLVN